MKDDDYVKKHYPEFHQKVALRRAEQYRKRMMYGHEKEEEFTSTETAILIVFGLAVAGLVITGWLSS